MIYDLKLIGKFALEELHKLSGDQQCKQRELQNHLLLAIAERLEALVEESKPRWVQFERYWNDDAVIIDAKRSPVIRVRHPKKDETLSVVVVNGQDVKGTLAEVIAKLRGDK